MGRDMNDRSNWYKCLKCPFLSQWDFALNNHDKQYHSGFNYPIFDCSEKVKIHTCKICLRQTPFRTCLKQHVETEHNLASQLLIDNSTGRYFKQEEVNNGTEIADNGQRVKFACPYCGITSFSQVFILCHIEACSVKGKKWLECWQGALNANSPKPPDDVNRFHCAHCSFNTPYKQNLSRHVQCKHTGGDKMRWFECTICDYKAKRRSHLKTHHMRKHDVNNEMKPAHCEFCDHRAINQSALRVHHNLKHATGDEIEWFECPYCDYRTKTAQVLRSHHKNRHMSDEGIRWFKCETCGYKAKWKSSLDAHKKTHLRVAKKTRASRSEEYECVKLKCFDCALCDFKTTTERNLKLHHLNMHALADEVKWFECKRCDFKSKFLKNLKTHYNSKHASGSEVNWFYCAICGFKTKWNNALYRHKLRHASDSEVKWFYCDFCEYRTKERRYLQSHHNIKHATGKDVKWFECKICDFRTRHRTNLTQHLKKHLADKEVRE